MPYEGNWLPGRRELQLAMAKNWLVVLEARAKAWKVPSTEVAELQTLTVAAGAALAMAQSSERTPVVTANCKAAFDALIAKMRFIKSRWFLSPPLTDADIISLELKPKDSTRTPVPPPAAQAEADISRPGVHLLDLHLRPAAGSPPDPHRSDYGHRVYYGVLPPGGASGEAATGAKRELSKAPGSGDDLPHSRFTRRKKELFDFPAEDSGKTVYFCVRYENAKGEPGPWGPMFSSIIP
ncbi:MAG: hypothetical protein LBH85_10330 [Treponema sp.]|jgi:hypothetical protein|nr:hypothetical protein [Treponema sp.]